MRTLKQSLCHFYNLCSSKRLSKRDVFTTAVHFSAVAFLTTMHHASSAQLIWTAALLNFCMLSLETITIK